ncbi:MAG: hypothetical protein DYG89_39350 [Caldilinea sp. CFX5]|nr:hypothetical protein [Caldilinea sp. CFX5]
MFLPSLFVLGVILGTTIKPQFSYNPKSSKLPLNFTNLDTPTQTTEIFLQQLAYLPPLTAEENCFDVLSSTAVGLPLTTNAERKIVKIEMTTVHLSATAPLLLSLLDDDPVYQSIVEVSLVTADDNKTSLTFTLWDYGLLTPWAFYQYGDGWKVDKLCYQPSA